MGEIRFNNEFLCKKQAISTPSFIAVSPIIMSEIDSDAEKASAQEGKFDICHTTLVCGRQKWRTILFNN